MSLFGCGSRSSTTRVVQCRIFMTRCGEMADEMAYQYQKKQDILHSLFQTIIIPTSTILCSMQHASATQIGIDAARVFQQPIHGAPTTCLVKSGSNVLPVQISTLHHRNTTARVYKKPRPQQLCCMASEQPSTSQEVGVYLLPCVLVVCCTPTPFTRSLRQPPPRTKSAACCSEQGKTSTRLALRCSCACGGYVWDVVAKMTQIITCCRHALPEMHLTHNAPRTCYQ